MATLKTFRTLVQLKHKLGKAYEIVGEPRLPKWFHVEYLEDPKKMYVEPTLVEIMFGKDGEHIPHVECTLHVLIHVNVWGPEKQAEILIFGPPNFQKDVAQMLSNVAHFCRMKLMEKEALEAGVERRLMAASKATTQPTPVKVRDAATQVAPVQVRDAAIQPAPVKVRDAATQVAPVQVHEVATQPVPVQVRDAATQPAPVQVRDAATQPAPVQVRDAATQPAPVQVRDAATQPAPVQVRDAATQPAPVQVRDAATQPAPVQVREAATQQTPVEVADDPQLVQLKAGEAFAQHTSGKVHQDVNGQSPTEVCEGATQRHSVDASEALSQKCPEDLEGGDTEISLDDSYVIIRPSRAVWEPFVML